MNLEVNNKKVVIAMSGGVDSSVAAALLVQKGYSVTGMMLKLWSDECGESENACCPPEAIEQARQVANIIGIPFYVLDTQDFFKKNVVDTFIDTLNKGMTPNPCYLCNKLVRWGFFLNRVLDSGFDYLATGHYARITVEGNHYSLRKGLDPLKDQSYILSGLNQQQLMHTIFPLGEMTKSKVRELAHQMNLPVAEKKDSQDLCFVGEEGYRDFIIKHSPESLISGNIKNKVGKIVGQHQGLSSYTIGQRKGIGSGNREPLFVLEKDSKNNELIIGTKQQLGKRCFSIIKSNWISDNLEVEFDCDVKIRYKANPVKAHVIANEKNINVNIAQPLRDITPGQIAVFYNNDIVIGSGIIDSVNIEEGDL
jgi:tRNA-uridine 2-sulfurtransferase